VVRVISSLVNPNRDTIPSGSIPNRIETIPSTAIDISFALIRPIVVFPPSQLLKNVNLYFSVIFEFRVPKLSQNCRRASIDVECHRV